MRSTNVYIRSTHFRNWSCSGVVNCHVFFMKVFYEQINDADYYPNVSTDHIWVRHISETFAFLYSWYVA